MTEQFASIELARLYESQGYIQDALAMYRTLIEEDGAVDVVSEAQEALTRLESIGGVGDEIKPEYDGGSENDRDSANADDEKFLLDGYGEAESRLADLLEKWLMLMVVQKRVNVYKSIRGRL